ncbi:MAG: signal recognition particle protein [Fibrobacteria bacterium]|nr:signal recognition particle protein [Fibrobacteria bacterium]
MLEQLSDKLEAAFKKIRGQGKITEENITESMREIRVALLSADVNYKTTKDFVKKLKERAIGEKVINSISPGQLMVKITHDELQNLLGEESAEPSYQGGTPFPMLVMGLQGSGKTTFCGKLALRLRSKFKKNPLLVACDVYRPAAISQLETIGKSLQIPTYSEGQGDPVTIAKNAIKYAQEHDHDIVIVDTAGRLQLDDKLMTELEDICEAIKPKEKFFVADAMTGQDAVNVSNEFNQRLDISGVVLSKLDGDTRGGAALSIRSVTGKPLIYVGTGEKPDALEVLHPDRLASRILGMGDVVSLVERAQDAIDEKEAKKMEKKLLQNKFDLNDFMMQLKQIKKMGSISDLVGMIPGMSKMKGLKVDEKQFVYMEAIMSSMTHKERSQPKIIDGNRRKRIAKGSGTSLQQVNQLLKQFDQMRKMIKQFVSVGSKKGKQMRNMMKQMQQQGGMPGS